MHDTAGILRLRDGAVVLLYGGGIAVRIECDGTMRPLESTGSPLVSAPSALPVEQSCQDGR